jgi:hypothetical protein
MTNEELKEINKMRRENIILQLQHPILIRMGNGETSECECEDCQNSYEVNDD